MVKLEELKKMSSEERIRLLKELEKEKRKEIEEAQKLISETEKEIEEHEEIRKSVPIPQIKAVSIDALFTREEKQVFAAKRFEKEEMLEGVTEEAKRQQAEDQERYVLEQAKKPTEDFLHRVEDTYKQAATEKKSLGYVTSETAQEAYHLTQEMQQRKKFEDEGSYRKPEALAESFNVSKQLTDAVLDWYKR
ncbi:MAG: hypothetical protein ABIF10_03075 [Candidatus Woesearchaeota archaeon]